MMPPPDSAADSTPVAAPVLVGLRGTGKTTIAHALAQRLSLPVVDADRALEHELGLTIPQIFAQHGEGWFRERECAMHLCLLARRDTILATGGGAVLHQAVRAALRLRPTIWLSAPPAVLADRIGGTDRPRLLADAPHMAAELAHLLAARGPLYAAVADVTVDTAALTAEQAIDAIAAYWQNLCATG